MLFASVPGGDTIKATAWYLNGTTSSATLQKATLGQYSSGLGICYPGEDCTNPNHQVDNNMFDEYILFEFSSPIDPSTVNITSTYTGDLDVTYWLGGTAGQTMNLTGLTTSLTGLGFGVQNDNLGTATGSRTVDLSGGVPAGPVNAILFGAKYLDSDDYFKVGGMAGISTVTTAVPEPSSVILLLTAGLAGWRWSRRAKRQQTA